MSFKPECTKRRKEEGREGKNIEGKKGIKREKKPTGYFVNRWVLITILKEAMVETPLVMAGSLFHR